MALVRRSRPLAKGSNAFLAASLTSLIADNVNLSGVARGLDNIDVTENEDSRDVPGGGVTSTRQNLGYKQGSSSITVDENDFTAPLFHGKNGRRFYVTYGPDGLPSTAATAQAEEKQKLTFEAIATITHTSEQRGPRRFTVEWQHDGIIDRSDFTSTDFARFTS